MLSATPTVGWRPSLGFKHARASLRAHGMYVPSDSFGGVSPEKKASQALEKLFTFISAKVILAQLEGSGRGALAAYNQEQYSTLFSHLQDTPVSDPDQWLEQLMRKDKALALRVMEVRAAYSKEDFEWDQLQRLSVQGINRSNLQLMRKAATASLQATQLVSSSQPTDHTDKQQHEQTTTGLKNPAATEPTPGSTVVQNTSSSSAGTQHQTRCQQQPPPSTEASGAVTTTKASQSNSHLNTSSDCSASAADDSSDIPEVKQAEQTGSDTQQS